MNSLLRKIINLLPQPVANGIHFFKHRIYWLTKGRKLHEHYFDEYRTRSKTIDVLRDCLSGKAGSTFRILELGCSGANNLRLLRETVSTPIRYVGFDIQPEAVAFARNKFPEELLIVGDDRKFLEQAPTLGRFDVFLASCVLYYIPEKRCQAVLSMAARIADEVIICDDLRRFDSPAGMNIGIFLHPYRRLCREAGLAIVKDPVPLSSGDRHSIFVARPLAD